MTDNVISFPIQKITKTTDPVAFVCKAAGETFKHVVIMGENEKGQVQMITTVADPAEVLWYMEAARFGIMTGGLEDEEE
jgi:hypothetical protein|tara:strand:- start:47 stop:283 length:237 start_codon:yes stop_codon:yes gene_type:complete